MFPLHPAVVHFPVALSVTSVVADTAAVLLGVSSLGAVGLWTLGGAVVMGALAVAAGYRDMNRDALEHETHELVHLHLRFGWAVLVSLGGLGAWRLAAGAPGLAYLLVAWLVVALVLFQGWLGGEMVYAYGAGVAAADQGQVPAQQAQRPSRLLYRRLMGRGLEEAGHLEPHHH